MIQIIWIISFIALSQGSKEPYQNLDQLLNDPDIWKYIQKRVDDGDTDKNYDPTPVKMSPKIDKTEKHEPYRHPELTETSKHKPMPYGMKTLSDTSGNSCNYRENSSMIIKSKTSLDKGAFYLKNAFGLSAKECVEKCCYTQNCNLAVYEDKVLILDFMCISSNRDRVMDNYAVNFVYGGGTGFRSPNIKICFETFH